MSKPNSQQEQPLNQESLAKIKQSLLSLSGEILVQLLPEIIQNLSPKHLRGLADIVQSTLALKENQANDTMLSIPPRLFHLRADQIYREIPKLSPRITEFEIKNVLAHLIKIDPTSIDTIVCTEVEKVLASPHVDDVGNYLRKIINEVGIGSNKAYNEDIDYRQKYFNFLIQIIPLLADTGFRERNYEEYIFANLPDDEGQKIDYTFSTVIRNLLTETKGPTQIKNFEKWLNSHGSSRGAMMIAYLIISTVQSNRNKK